MMWRSQRAGDDDEPGGNGGTDAEHDTLDDGEPRRDAQTRNELIGRAQTLDAVVKRHAESNRGSPRRPCGYGNQKPTKRNHVPLPDSD